MVASCFGEGSAVPQCRRKSCVPAPGQQHHPKPIWQSLLLSLRKELPVTRYQWLEDVPDDAELQKAV